MDNVGKHLQGGLAFTENDLATHATDIFRPIQQEVSMVSSHMQSIQPQNMNQSGPYYFHIPTNGSQYIQANQIRLHMFVEIQKSDGTAITAADGAGVCNLLGNSMFQSMEIEINGRKITELENTHSNYKAYLETLLSYGDESRTSTLSNSLWKLDKASHFDDTKYGATTATNTSNDGLDSRRKNTLTKFDLYFPLHFDFFNSDRYIPPTERPILFKLNRAKDSFCFMNATSTTSFKLVISNMRLYVPYVTLSPAILERHKELIQTTPAVFPIKKTEILVQHVGSGGRNVQVNSVFGDRIPKSLIIGLLAPDSYDGTNVSKNPYNFKHFDLNEIYIKHNGTQIPADSYRPDWSAKLYAREHRSFFDNIGIGIDNIPCAITSSLYANGCTFFAFDLSPDKCNGYHTHEKLYGSINIEMSFKNPIPSGGMTVMMYGVHDAQVTLDKFDEVVVTYI